MATMRTNPSTHGTPGFSVMVEHGRRAAEQGVNGLHRFLSEARNHPRIETALRIKAVEQGLYTAFGQGKLHGTIHTCIGQEFSGAVLSGYLRDDDFVTSNHRCHGHFIAATGNWRGLIDEIVGNKDGVCAGIGSSQHLWAPNFLSNGQQGGLLPVAAGVAMDRKLRGGAGAVVSFIGEGTLGEGIVYETLNLDSLWDLPHLIICENNFYSQSTAQRVSVAGTIEGRAAAFGIKSIEANTWDLENLDQVLEDLLNDVRVHALPAFLVLTTYRLNPHSKGDDIRDAAEVAWFRDHDPATIAIRDYKQFQEVFELYEAEVAMALSEAFEKPSRLTTSYFETQLPDLNSSAQEWQAVPLSEEPHRVSQQLNAFYRQWLAEDSQAMFLGEDVADPYGGAFKISKGLSVEFQERVVTTPISEAGICGVGIGLANMGRRALVEIMFGDFITYAFDQLINNASKMFHMYDQHVSCPVVIRTPMGGRRGYGPTHSQSLERFLIGIDNCCTVSVNSLVPIDLQLNGLKSLQCPVVLLENKSDYTVRTFAAPPELVVSTNGACLPTIRVAPIHDSVTVTLIAYGGMARYIANHLIQIFEEADCIPELIVPVCLSPIDLRPIVESLEKTRRILIIEEGAGFGSVGAEMLAQLAECLGMDFVARRLSGSPTPIPSAPLLEAASLPSIEDVCNALNSLHRSDAVPSMYRSFLQTRDNFGGGRLCQ